MPNQAKRPRTTPCRQTCINASAISLRVGKRWAIKLSNFTLRKLGKTMPTHETIDFEIGWRIFKTLAKSTLAKQAREFELCTAIDRVTKP